MNPEITNIEGVGATTASILSEHKFGTVISIANASVEQLTAVPGFSAIRASRTIEAAKQLLVSTASASETDASTSKSEAPSKEKSGKGKKEKNKKAGDKKSKDKKNKGKKKKDKAKDKKKNKKNKKK